jgi:trypsin
MKTFILLAVCLTLASAKSFSKKAISTPLSRGGGRIVGGTNAARDEFPHQIILTRGVGGSLMCGGSLVAPNRVITAGHCCDGQSASRLGVVVGAYIRNNADESEKDIAVSKLILHEDYNSNTINNDICMLWLEEEANFADANIAAISLPMDMEDYEEGTDCVVTGWGTTSEGGSLANTLQKVTVPVVSDDHCRDSYGQSDIADSMICAGLDAGGKDSCQGDSGGPFMCGNQLSGVVSWGYGCAEAGYPGVYTQTSYFVKWVNNNM